MHKHEQKNCPRCNSPFECKVGDVGRCQCAGFTFSEEERSHMELVYDDCLCRNCLLELKNRHTMFTERMHYKK